jgi:ADP-ribosylglycohydrolase
LAELNLLAEQGRVSETLEAYRREIAGTAVDRLDVDHYWQQLGQLPRRDDWPYAEPSDYAGILATLAGSQSLPAPNPDTLFSKLHGGVLGRCAGMMLGKPLEGLATAANVRRYLDHADAYPLTNYVPRVDPIPDDVILNPIFNHWHHATLGNITQVVQDDDIEYVIAAYHILKTYGHDFTTADVGAFWLSHFAYGRVHTAEHMAYRNLVNGMPADQAARHQNPYREWIGAQIRTDVYGYVCPGQPRRAAEMAFRDAALKKKKNGIYGGMWVAAMIAAAYVMDSPADVVRAGLAEIPPQSRFHEAIVDVLDWCERDDHWEETLSRIQHKYGTIYKADEGFGWVQTIPNACLVALGMLHGGSDFGRGIAIAVMGGWDTDCTGATVGSVLGVMKGAESLPGQWTDPLNNVLESYVPGYNRMKISDLAEGIYRLIA